MQVQGLTERLAPGGAQSTDLQPIVILVEAQLAKPAVQVGGAAVRGDEAQVDRQVELPVGTRNCGEQRECGRRPGAPQ